MSTPQLARELVVAETLEQGQAIVELGSVHKKGLPRATRSLAAEPEPVDRASLRTDIESKLLADVPWFYRAERRIAREQAAAKAEARARREEHQRRTWVEREQALLDYAWGSLQANETSYVAASLESSLDEHPLPAHLAAVTGAVATIILEVSSLERQMPERVADVTPTGRLTTRKLSKTARNELALEVLASNVLGVARRALAAAPGVEEVRVAAVRDGDLLYWGSFERRRLSHLDWEAVDPVVEAETAPGARLEVRGRTRELRPLDVAAAPPGLRSLLAELL